MKKTFFVLFEEHTASIGEIEINYRVAFFNMSKNFPVFFLDDRVAVGMDYSLISGILLKNKDIRIRAFWFFIRRKGIERIEYFINRGELAASEISWIFLTA